MKELEEIIMEIKGAKALVGALTVVCGSPTRLIDEDSELAHLAVEDMLLKSIADLEAYLATK